MDELTRLRTEAQTAGSEAGKLQESIPGLLSGLKSNLNSIFTKDNPEFAQRENALTNFLNIPSQTRAELLPQNQPIFGGSPLNVSPSQQEAIVTARRNAALVPLAGLNQSIVGQYGNLADMLANAGSIYQTQILGAQNQASIAQKAFENALAQEKEAREGRTAGGGGIDIVGALRQLGYGQGTGTTTKGNLEDIVEPDIESNQPSFNNQPSITQVPSFATIQQPVNNGGLSYNAGAAPSNMSFWDSLLSLIGATPKIGLEQPAQPIQQPVQQPSLWNYQNATEIANRGRG